LALKRNQGTGNIDTASIFEKTVGGGMSSTPHSHLNTAN